MRVANSLLFFLHGEFLGNYDQHSCSQGTLTTNFLLNLTGLFSEADKIYTEQDSKTVGWSPQWIKTINKSSTWFQTRFDLDRLVREDLNVHPVLLDALGLNRYCAFVNKNDFDLYWLVQDGRSGASSYLQGEIRCGRTSQRHYHIPSDWLTSKNNLLTVFEDLGAPSSGSVGIVQRMILT